MTEKDLDELSGRLECWFPQEGSKLQPYHRYSGVCDCTTLELIKLARLGLWARDVAAPTLDFLTKHEEDYVSDLAKRTLNKMPKEDV